jgi:hypothetical protein
VSNARLPTMTTDMLSLLWSRVQSLESSVKTGSKFAKFYYKRWVKTRGI